MKRWPGGISAPLLIVPGSPTNPGASPRTELGMKAFQNQDEAGAAAVDYLRVIGHLVLSYLWVRMAKIALAKADEPFYAAKLTVARFYFAKLQPETASLMRTVRSGAASLMELEPELF